MDSGSASASSPPQRNADARKAKSLYEDLKKKHGEEPDGASFNVSHGWFHQFKARASLHNVKVSGEVKKKKKK